MRLSRGPAAAPRSASRSRTRHCWLDPTTKPLNPTTSLKSLSWGANWRVPRQESGFLSWDPTTDFCRGISIAEGEGLSLRALSCVSDLHEGMYHTVPWFTGAVPPGAPPLSLPFAAAPMLSALQTYQEQLDQDFLARFGVSPLTLPGARAAPTGALPNKYLKTLRF